jgi:hypothetical protein
MGLPSLHYIFDKKSRRVFETLLLEVGDILEAFNCHILIGNLDTWSDHASVLIDAQSPVNSHQTDANAVAYQHGNHSTSICRRLIGTEGLWSDKIADGIANVQDGELDVLLRMSSCVSLGQGDADNVWTKVGVAL